MFEWLKEWNKSNKGCWTFGDCLFFFERACRTLFPIKHSLNCKRYSSLAEAQTRSLFEITGIWKLRLVEADAVWPTELFCGDKFWIMAVCPLQMANALLLMENIIQEHLLYLTFHFPLPNLETPLLSKNAQEKTSPGQHVRSYQWLQRGYHLDTNINSR